MLVNRDRVIEYLGRSRLDAIVLALPVSVAYATDHESSFETAFRGYMLFPGGGTERFFRSFAVVSANGERALVSHAAIAVSSYVGWDEALEVYGGEGFDLSIVARVPPEMRLVARRLAGRTFDRSPMEAVAAARFRPLRRVPGGSASSTTASTPRSRRPEGVACGRHRAARCRRCSSV